VDHPVGKGSLFEANVFPRKEERAGLGPGNHQAKVTMDGKDLAVLRDLPTGAIAGVSEEP